MTSVITIKNVISNLTVNKRSFITCRRMENKVKPFLRQQWIFGVQSILGRLNIDCIDNTLECCAMVSQLHKRLAMTSVLIGFN